jgi:hypothetical protein
MKYLSQQPEEFLIHPIAARLAGMVSTTCFPLLTAKRRVFFDNNQTYNIMTKYITRDKLADFVEKMWDAEIKVESVDVVDRDHYENLINEVKCSLLSPHDPGNTINMEG